MVGREQIEDALAEGWSMGLRSAADLADVVAGKLSEVEPNNLDHRAYARAILVSLSETLQTSELLSKESMLERLRGG